jgi:DHA1 family bicyclomycin/chloramphenicol resistance-like MFS transporter
MFAYVTGVPTVLTSRYGLSPREFGWLIALNGVAFMTASQLNIRSLHTMSPQQVLARYIWAPSVLAGALLVATLLWATPLWVIVVLQLSFFVSVGRINPNVFALAMDPHAANAGAASALMGALQSVAAVAAGLAVAVFNNGEPATLAAIMMAGGLLAASCYVWIARAR